MMIQLIGFIISGSPSVVRLEQPEEQEGHDLHAQYLHECASEAAAHGVATVRTRTVRGRRPEAATGWGWEMGGCIRNSLQPRRCRDENGPGSRTPDGDHLAEGWRDSQGQPCSERW